MKYGFCPICGLYATLEEPGDKAPESGFRMLHQCPPRWLCTFGHEGEHDYRPIYATTARQAAEKYAQWYDQQYCENLFQEGTDETVTVIDDRTGSTEKGRRHRFAVESEIVREYHATEARAVKED